MFTVFVILERETTSSLNSPKCKIMPKVLPSGWWVILVWPPESRHSQEVQMSGWDSKWRESHWGWGGQRRGPGWSQTRPGERRSLEPHVWCRWCPEPSTSSQSHWPEYRSAEEHPHQVQRAWRSLFNQMHHLMQANWHTDFWLFVIFYCLNYTFLVVFWLFLGLCCTGILLEIGKNTLYGSIFFFYVTTH